MGLPNIASDDGETVGWLADREFLKVQHRACVALLAHLAEAGTVPAEHGLCVYLEALTAAFEDRERELAVPSIRAGARQNRLERMAVAEAREVYANEASSKYLRDVAKACKGVKRAK